MFQQKRRLSESTSASTPATPAMGSPAKSPIKSPEKLPQSLEGEVLANRSRIYSMEAGPSRGDSATPAPGLDDRTAMKPVTLVPGSGDGSGAGDECFMWTDLPMNRNGYRYYPCTPSPVMAPNPSHPFYRTLPGPPPCPPVHISWTDRSSFLRISPNALTASTDRGYRSGRTNVSVRSGTWYYEATIERGDGPGGAGKGTGETGNAHVRVGWARREANLDAPVGADAYGYGIRDVGGEKVHISRPKPYGRSFKTGDTIGCLIHLPPRPPVASEDDPAHVRRWRIPLRYKGQSYFEMDEYPPAREMEALVNREGKVAEEEPKKKPMKKPGKTSSSAPVRPPPRVLPTLPGSYVSFYLNGEPLAPEPAFTELFDFLPLPQQKDGRHVGRSRLPASLEREREQYQYHDDGTLGYFPTISCFGRGKVRVNFGPSFDKPPADLPADTRPVCERWDEFRAEELVYDERDEVALAQRQREEMEQAEEMAAKAAAKAAARASGTPTAAAKRPSKKRKKATPGPGDTAPPTAEGTPVGTPGVRDGTDTPGPETPQEEGASATGMFESVYKAHTYVGSPLKASSPIKPSSPMRESSPVQEDVKMEGQW